MSQATRRQWPRRSPYVFLALLSCCVCLALGLGRVGYAQSSVIQSSVIATGPVEQASIEQALVEQGLERYHQGDVPGAIALWEDSLKQQNNIDSATGLAVVPVKQYLARAYQQVGQLSEAMAALESVADYYRNTGDVRQLGRMLTEQAQVYGELGQPQNALVMLCGEDARVQQGSVACERAAANETENNENNQARNDQARNDGALALAVQQADPKGRAAALGALGQTYYLQGNYPAAISALEASLELARTNRYAPYQIAANETLGNVYVRLAQRSYNYAEFAQQAQDASEMERLTAEAQNADRAAIGYFQQALALAQGEADAGSLLRSQLNLVLPTYRISGALNEANALLMRAQQQVALLPSGREKAYASIRIAGLAGKLQSLSAKGLASMGLAQGNLQNQALSVNFTQCVPISEVMVEQLQQAAEISREIGDGTAESFAMGWLGHLYECEGDYVAATRLTERAQLLAQQPETRYLWEWQSGRILKAQGRVEEAIALYEQTVTTLKQVESDIAVANRDLRLDFRDTVEGIYRQLTKLQLSQAVREPLDQKQVKQSVQAKQQDSTAVQDSTAAAERSVPTRSRLLSALYTLDGLRLAELRNYLGGECDLPLIAQPPEALSPTTATISTLILEDSLAVILALPEENGGEIQAVLHEVPLTQATLTQQVNEFRYALEQRSDRTNGYLVGSQQMYDWLVRPFEAVLRDRDIQTLAFNHDGILRMVPMAALHDGEQFLVERYALTSSPSFAAATTPLLLEDKLQVLAFGLTEAASVSPTEQFASLQAVATELAQIEETLPNSTVLLNEEFTRPQLEASLATSPFSVLHLATHAQFGYDAEDTFLVTGEKTEADERYNRPLRLNELYRLLRQEQLTASSLEMLMLSACETAVGSERDALGIAGVAIQAGVESAVASLWQVDDSATAALTTGFYRYLQAGERRRVALQQAQRDWLNSQGSGYQHPGYWAALVLVENGAI